MDAVKFKGSWGAWNIFMELYLSLCQNGMLLIGFGSASGVSLRDLLHL